ncbi:TNF receptor-associated factor 3-like isoform X2 [Argopecten irradians]|uniref:TNF receptor-associated factor 3-like isoform X2 n=1 Tax=Argopecten irradians TaxID=31199 RepID=UPI003716F13C
MAESHEFVSLSMQQTPPGHPFFVNLDTNYRCIACRDVLRDAVQTLCGHRLCEVFRDPCARREIATLLVYCSNKDRGCKETMQWKQLEGHDLRCDYKAVQCSFVTNGCDVCTTRQNLEDHLQQCQYRNILCAYCQEETIFNQTQDHESFRCRKYPIACPNDCGATNLRREDLKDHEQECPQRQSHCKFSNMGCGFSGSMEAVRKHEGESLDQHLQLTTVYTASTDLQSMAIHRELQDIYERQHGLQKSVNRSLREVEDLRKEAEGTKKTIKNIKLQSAEQAERMIYVERRLEDAARKDVLEKNERDIQGLQNLQTSISDGLRLLEQGGDRRLSAGNIDSQLQYQERKIGLLDVRFVELDLRLQIHESASFNGVLMWRIQNYRRRKCEAINGKTLSLYSQPFYTSQFGYKMCARVYLNGDGMGKGTHMSLFFVVMRGDFDALLPWPFEQKVTMMLLDQDTGTKNLSDCFRPDPASQSFKRPQTEMNTASGCPVFVSHKMLETKTYLMEDTVFIKIQVDTDDINPP